MSGCHWESPADCENTRTDACCESVFPSSGKHRAPSLLLFKSPVLLFSTMFFSFFATLLFWYCLPLVSCLQERQWVKKPYCVLLTLNQISISPSWPTSAPSLGQRTLREKLIPLTLLIKVRREGELCFYHVGEDWRYNHPSPQPSLGHISNSSLVHFSFPSF